MSLIELCKAFEDLYGKVKQCVLNYGPVYGFWCFPFERFNGILGSFQKNWISPELQMFRKFLTYQVLLLSNVLKPTSRVCEFFQLQLGMHGEFIIIVRDQLSSLILIP